MRFGRTRLERDGLTKRFARFWVATQPRENLAQGCVNARIGWREVERIANFRFRLREAFLGGDRQSQIEMRLGALRVAFHHLAEEFFRFRVTSLLARPHGRLVLNFGRAAARFQGHGSAQQKKHKHHLSSGPLLTS